jgi:AbrB family looped-hinge helix DNA binding protein
MVAVKATMTSKGQITVPVSVRPELGLIEGEQVEFTLVDRVATVQRCVTGPNPFEKWVGCLGGATDGDALMWQCNLRDEWEQPLTPTSCQRSFGWRQPARS